MWEDDFKYKLRIRDSSQHSRCSICCKHRAVIRRLTDNREARLAQCRLWDRHISRQYADRQVYWTNRASSRLGTDAGGNRTLTMIVDSMDRSKWVVPRSAALQSKSFSSLIRPVLDCTGMIVHGHYVGIAFAEPHVIKGSDWSCELVVAVLEKLTQSGLDLRSFDLRLHADNCTKELKNNSLCRLLGLLVARGRVRRASLECLQTGHSHEDVDQFFHCLEHSCRRRRKSIHPLNLWWQFGNISAILQ